MNNAYMSARTVDELRAMELDLYNETHDKGRFIEGSEEYYIVQMELLESAFAALFPDDYDYHRRGRQQLGKE